MLTLLRVAGLAWADGVMDGVFFIMQKYLTDVWKLSFTNAASLLNIWGGIYRILPIFFLFLADTLFGNFITLTFSAISSTAGLVLITVATAPAFGKAISTGTCQEIADGATTCVVGHTEKVLFITGMVSIAVGKAARVASTESFLNEQFNETNEIDQTNNEINEINETNETNNEINEINETNETNDETNETNNEINETNEIDETNETNEAKEDKVNCLYSCWVASNHLAFVTPLIVIFGLSNIKRWYVLFGVSAICSALSTLFYLSGVRSYKKGGPNPKGSPMTDILRVFVAAAFKIFRPFPQDSAQLHRIQGEGFSSSRILRFLHKASIKSPGETVGSDTRSWKVCSVSEVESVKTIIRMVPMWIPFIMLGIVSSAGNTYFVEQATHMTFTFGSWNPPLQILLLIFTIIKFVTSLYSLGVSIAGKDGVIAGGTLSALCSILCTTVAAAVERRRLHDVRRNHLLDQPDDSKVPMRANMLYYQVGFLSMLDGFSQSSISAFHLIQTPTLMKRYEDCFSEALAGLGFISSALSVFVVGKVSEMGSSKNWFQYTLNRSRLDRYYWVLATLCTLNLFLFIAMFRKYRFKERWYANEDEEFEANAKELGTEVVGIKRTSTLGILWNRILSE